MLKNLVHDDKGATIVEYGLLLAVVAMTALAGITMIGHHFAVLLRRVSAAL